jgi:hypothetical protein
MLILPTLPTSSLGGAGKIGRAFKPGSNTGYTSFVPYSNTNLQFPNSNFSFGGWCAGINTTGVAGYIGGRLGSAVGAIQMYLAVNAATQIVLAASTDGSAQTLVTTSELSDSTNPAFIVATLDRTNNLLRLRIKRSNSPSADTNVNNTNAFSSALSTYMSDVNFALNGGQSSDNTLYPGSSSLVGTPQFDSWFYCLKALTDAEVSYLYNLGAGKNYAALAMDSGH